ncbi:TPA: helix-turn-helix transcriptional regulator [Vibrio parahaemolyticus]|nr:helix-turn-helix transcriptional regulator [Vibrio parahaemolyticus]
MSNQTAIRRESYEITKNSCNEFKLTQSVSTKTDGNLIHVSIDVKPPKRKNISSLSSFIDGLVESDPSLKGDLVDARKEIVELLYQDQKDTLKVLRLQKGWSQADLAKMINTSQPQIAKIESGKVDVQMSTVIKLSKAFEMKVGDMSEILAASGGV